MKILICDSKSVTYTKIRQHLSKYHCDIIGCTFADLVPQNYYDVAFFGVDHCSENETIKRNVIKISKMSKWVVTLLYTNDHSVRRQCFENGSNMFLFGSALDTDIEQKIDYIMHRIGSIWALHINEIKALVNFSNTAHFALKMHSILARLRKHEKLDGESYERSKIALTFFSLSFVQEDISKLIYLREELNLTYFMHNFFGSYGISHDVLEVYAIVNYTRQKNGLEPFFFISDDMSDDYKRLYSEIETIDYDNIYIINTKEDAKQIQSIVLNQLDKIYFEAPDDYENMLNAITETILHNALYHYGCIVYVQTDTIRVEPNDNIYINRCFRLIKSEHENLASHPFPVVYNSKRIGINFEIIKTTCDLPILKNHQKVGESAVDFIYKNNISLEETSIFNELEEAILDLIEGMHYRDFNAHKLQLINQNLYKYASNIVFYHEFSTLANKLMELSKRMQTLDDISIEARWHSISFLLETFILNLRSWRESIFVRQDADDINFLDTSLISDLEQIYTFLADNDDNEDNIEFF